MSRSPTRVVVAQRAQDAGSLIDALSVGPALQDGRCFVNARRVLDPSTQLVAGDRVEVFEARPALSEVALLGNFLGVFAFDKPAALPSAPERAGTSSALVQASQQLGRDVGSLHLLTRLDVGVSGVLLIASSAEANLLVERARRQGSLVRQYIGLCHGGPPEDAGWLDATIGGADRRGRRRVKVSEGRPARTHYTVLGRVPEAAEGGASLLLLVPATGRTHQIRAHLGHQSTPLFGDRRYGGHSRITSRQGAVRALERIFLHCLRIGLDAGGASWQAAAPLPAELADVWNALGGDETSWARAESLTMSTARNMEGAR